MRIPKDNAALSSINFIDFSTLRKVDNEMYFSSFIKNLFK